MTVAARRLALAALFVPLVTVAGCNHGEVGTALPTVATPVLPTPAAVVTYTLSGSVSEATSAGRTPIAGAEVEVGVCPPLNGSPQGYERAVTDAHGFYSVPNMCAGLTYVWVAKDGYRTNPTRQCDGDCLFATIAGDSRFDVELVRQ